MSNVSHIIYKLMNDVYVVKPVLRCHLCDKDKMIFEDRCHFKFEPWLFLINLSNVIIHFILHACYYHC